MNDPFRDSSPKFDIQSIGKAPVPPRSSGKATASIVLGILAIPMFWLVLPAIGAIVMGHLALRDIRNSGGRLLGKASAVIGLLAGYLTLGAALICAAFIGWIVSLPSTPKTPAQQRLNTAEHAIGTDSAGIAHGNTEAARRLAEKFATVMENVDKEAFTQTGATVKLSGGHYVTWCELDDGRCVFISHVPEYRRFTSDAKETLAKLAWLAAQRVAEDELKPGDKLGVGLKGVILYGAVMVGTIPAGDPSEKPESHGTDSDELLPLLKRPGDDHAAAKQP